MASGTITSASIQTVKMVLMSAGVVFIGILLSLSLPHLLSSATSSDLIPSLWSSFRSWLRPPYLYVIINGIIITIAATSRLHHHHHSHHHTPPSESSPKVITPSPSHHTDVISIRADHHHHQLFSPYDAVSVTEIVSDSNPSSYYGAVSVKDVEVEVIGSRFEEEREKRIVEENIPFEEDQEREVLSTVDEMSTWTPPAPLSRQRPVDELLTSQQRPQASLRFGHHRKPAKVSSAEGGKALRRVAKPKKHDTLESTWKAITEKRHMPLTRHLKKSDTWENQSRQINLLDDDLTAPPVKKSETFKDRTNNSPPPVPAPKLKKEPSLSQDELNRRVEAFINKFNEEMRLQRQQSIQQFMEKINRAA